MAGLTGKQIVNEAAAVGWGSWLASPSSRTSPVAPHTSSTLPGSIPERGITPARLKRFRFLDQSTPLIVCWTAVCQEADVETPGPNRELNRPR